MDDPVIAVDGHTYVMSFPPASNLTSHFGRYNRCKMWLKQHTTSPRTNEPLAHTLLIPNLLVRQQIAAWREQHGLPALDFNKAPASAAARPSPFLSLAIKFHSMRVTCDV